MDCLILSDTDSNENIVTEYHQYTIDSLIKLLFQT